MFNLSVGGRYVDAPAMLPQGLREDGKGDG
jgi:hypothetical protein